MSYKNIVKNDFYKTNFKKYKFIVTKKTRLIWDRFENTGQNASRITLSEQWDTKLKYGQSRIIQDIWSPYSSQCIRILIIY